MSAGDQDGAGQAAGRDRQDPGEDLEQGEVHQHPAGGAAHHLQAALPPAGPDQGAVQADMCAMFVLS